MLLLPIPCVMLFGGTALQIAALAIFTVLALTDWLDGKLARRDGPTVLGSLLDPIADKMFLAFTYIPMSRIEGVYDSGLAMVPVWYVMLMFFRELSVTGMRSLAASQGIEFRTATLAKFKTGFQMAGGGFLLWTVVWQNNRLVQLSAMAALVGVPVGIALWRKIKGRGIGAKVWTQIFMYIAVLIAVALTSTRNSLWAIAGIILVMTLLSGGQYALRVMEGLRKKGTVPWHGLVLGLAEALFPVLVVGLLVFASVPAWAVIAMLTAELAAGGLADLLASEGVHRRPGRAWGRVALLALCGIAGWVIGLWLPEMTCGPWCAAVAAALVSGAYCAGLFIAHRPVYMR
jgi:phosphatidylglycerophosphate synthase